MKKILLTMLILFPCLVLFGQGNVTKEINEQVWLPFIKGFTTEDQELFKSVHSKDIVRVSQDQSELLNYDKYFKKVPDSVKARWAVWKKNIELRFIQRISADGNAFEVGYYRSTSTNSQTGEKRQGIGKFHVLLKKENGKWKIVMDVDSAKGVTEDDFNKSKPLQD
jgi:ketosteroid isomerase-like protein